MKFYDVIVIGGGHAGTEAALASARTGARTLLLTHNIETLGQMSCNPSIGGIGKGHLVKEIDALGGIMARAADLGGIQFRTLNASKGPAVRATRVQADRILYKKAVRQALETQANLEIFQQSVKELLIEKDQVVGVRTEMDLCYRAKAVVLTAGTFLAGKIHVGDRQTQGGRAGDPASLSLSQYFHSLPFRIGRLKTGTPPRIDGRSLDYSKMQIQPGDDPRPVFSFMSSREDHPEQLPCYITKTTEATRDIIQKNLHRSAMYSGNIEGVGPRYCPSIEDKMVRFADKLTHQIFVEPEGLYTAEIYPNGISTSLPYEVQEAFVRSIVGFESAHITRPGYAIEYDFFDPRDLRPSLESKIISALFFAGQINGTTGYEEAAAQGIIAGLNAARYARGQEAWSPRRDQAYIGVLIDDLITLGTQEPYRMFTSRAEYRLLLREDNADLRLTEIGRQLGLVDDQRFRKFEAKKAAIHSEGLRLKTLRIHPETCVGEKVGVRSNQPLSREYPFMELLKRPEISYDFLMSFEELGPGVEDPLVSEQIEIQAKYSGYIERQELEIERQQKYEILEIPANFKYEMVTGLSSEIKQKLTLHRPATIGMASRISGVTPAAISLLLVYLKR